MLLEHYGL
jgi:hypothetical protein